MNSLAEFHSISFKGVMCFPWFRVASNLIRAVKEKKIVSEHQRGNTADSDKAAVALYWIKKKRSLMMFDLAKLSLVVYVHARICIE